MSVPAPLIAFATAALVAALTTPLFATLARRTGLVVQPRADRWHGVPTPLLGGAAMATATLPLLAAALTADPIALTLVVGGAAAFALGLFDDIRRIAPTSKLVGQILVAGIAVGGGVRVALLQDLPLLAFVVGILWIVAVMNAVNLIDNMDGLAAGITAIGAAGLALSAYDQRPLAALVAATTGGAALGFLVHNRHPARVFMGDAGSMLLGYLLAVAALLHTAGAAANVGLAVIAPLTVLALPIFDTLLVTVSRRLHGLPVQRGGRDHTSHRLAALGLSDREAVWLLYGVAAALAGLGALVGALSSFVWPLAALAAVSLVLFGTFLARVRVYDPTDGASADAPEARLWRRAHVYARFGAEVGLDLVLLTVAYYLSYPLRYEGMPDEAWLPHFIASVPIVVGFQLAALVVLRVYRTLWRYIGIGDAVAIARAVTLGTVAAAFAILFVSRFGGYSRVVFVFDWLLAILLLVGARSFTLWLQHVLALRPRADARRVLIVGANDTGQFALRQLAVAPGAPHRAIGFLDDDPGKRYRRLAGVPILGSSGDLADVVSRHQVDLVVVADDGSDSAAVERVRATCAEVGVEFRDLMLRV